MSGSLARGMHGMDPSVSTVKNKSISLQERMVLLMRKERGRIENGKLVIVDWAHNRNNDKYETWYCASYYAMFKDGVHQREIWFRDAEITHNACDLDAADCYYNLDCAYEENGWKMGFYYGCHTKTSHRHSCIAFAEGLGNERQIHVRSIEVID